MASFDNSPFLRQKISTRLYPKPTSFSTGVFVRWSRSGFDPAPTVLCRALHKQVGSSVLPRLDHRANYFGFLTTARLR
jgi:hypothetical protein